MMGASGDLLKIGGIVTNRIFQLKSLVSTASRFKLDQQEKANITIITKSL